MRTDEHPRTGWTLPRRSATDRKLGGVAGGLGRAWRIDPILIRVAFVVLALFGGSGVVLYCAGWLVMRGDGDEVSAVEALAGRGRSSVSPVLAIVLVVVGIASMGSVFSWGLPFWPVVTGSIILVIVLRHRGSTPGSRPPTVGWADDFADRASRWGREAGDRAARWGQDVGDRAARWGREVGDRAGGWFGGAPGPRVTPDAWPPPAGPGAPAAPTGTADEAAAGTTGGETAPDPAGTTAGDPAGSTAGTTAGDPAGSTAGTTAGMTPPPASNDPLAEGRTPPAWDPLGAAPFAWDLPEPSPVADTPPAGQPAAAGRAVGRIFLGLAVIVGAVTAAGTATGVWDLSWGAVGGITLAVLAIGLAVAAARGRGGRMLIGPGIFLAVLTLALSVSGIEGTSGFGHRTWAPAAAESVADSYHWNAGQATLDLSAIAVPKGVTVHTDVSIGGGQVTVLLPPSTSVSANCSATVGQVDCLGLARSGVHVRAVADVPGSSDHGTIDIDIHSNAGQAVLRTHE